MKSIIVGNWKMNPSTTREAKQLFDATKRAADGARHITVVVAPPSIFLRELKRRYKGRRILFAVQNARAEAGGAYTGEISLAQAKDAGASYVIIGHAERRGMGETNDDTRKKVAAALALKMTPILCVGEKERTQGGEHYALVKEQLRAGLADVQPSQLKQIFVVYEPLWTIGKDTAMSPRDMHEMAIFIRKSIVDLSSRGGSASGGKGHDAAMKIKILYGGSVDSTNVAAMRTDGDVHGFLVGRASISAAQVTSLLQALEKTA